MPFTKGTGVKDKARASSLKKRQELAKMRAHLKQRYTLGAQAERVRESAYKKSLKKLPGYPFKSFSKKGLSMPSMAPAHMGAPQTPPMRYEETVPLEQFPRRTQARVSAGWVATMLGIGASAVTWPIVMLEKLNKLPKTLTTTRKMLSRYYKKILKVSNNNRALGWIAKYKKPIGVSAAAGAVVGAAAYAGGKFADRRKQPVAQRQELPPTNQQ